MLCDAWRITLTSINRWLQLKIYQGSKWNQFPSKTYEGWKWNQFPSKTYQGWKWNQFPSFFSIFSKNSWKLVRSLITNREQKVVYLLKVNR